MRNALKSSNEVGSLKVLRVVRPHVLEHLLDVQLTELVQDVTHETRLSNCLLDLRESLCNNLLATHHACYRAGNLAQDVVRCVDGLLSHRHRVGNGLNAV